MLSSYPPKADRFSKSDTDLGPKAVIERREVNYCGLYGIGLKIDVFSPHEVLKVIDLRDASGKPAPPGAVKVLDVLLSVDGMCVENRDASVLETTILGPNGSTVKLTMRCREKQVVYDFVATRHVPIRVWDEVAVTRFVREDLIGQNLLAEPSIVNYLENIRRAFIHTNGKAVDLLRDTLKLDGINAIQCSLGLIFALEVENTNLKPTQVFAVVPGSPASLVASLLPGDEVVAVDGIEANEGNLIKLIQGDNIVGSSCTLSIARPNGGSTENMHANSQYHNNGVPPRSRTVVAASAHTPPDACDAACRTVEAEIIHRTLDSKDKVKDGLNFSLNWGAEYNLQCAKTQKDCNASHSSLETSENVAKHGEQVTPELQHADREFNQKAVEYAEVTVDVVAARDLPVVGSMLIDPFVCVSIIQIPSNSMMSPSDLDHVSAQLDHCTTAQAHSGALRYTWRRSDSGRHIIKFPLTGQLDPSSRLEPLVRTRTLEHTLNPQWNETFTLKTSYKDILADSQQQGSLEGSSESPSKAHIHCGQQLMALITVHGKNRKLPSKNNKEEADIWCGRKILQNICVGKPIDGWFQLEQADGSPVVGKSGKPACVCLKITYQPSIAESGSMPPSTCSTGVSRCEGKHFDVTLFRVKAKRIDKFQEIVSWFTLLERELEASSRDASVAQSLPCLHKLVISLEEERCREEIGLANRLHLTESMVVEEVLCAESALHGLDDFNGPKLTAQILQCEALQKEVLQLKQYASAAPKLETAKREIEQLTQECNTHKLFFETENKELQNNLEREKLRSREAESMSKRRAEEIEKLKNEMRDLSSELGRASVVSAAAKADSARFQADAATFQSEVIQARAERDTVRSELAREKMNIDGLRADLTRTMDQLNSLQSEVSKAKAEAHASKEWAESKTTHAADIDRANTELQNNLEREKLRSREAESMSKRLAEEIEKLKNEMRDLSSELGRASVVSAAAKADSARFQADAATFQSEVIQARAERDTVRSELAREKMNIDGLRADLTRTMDQLNSLQSEVSKAKAEAHASKEWAESKTTHAADIDRANTELQNNLEREKLRSREAESMSKRLAEEIEKLKNEMRDLSSELGRASVVSAAAKEDLERLQADATTFQKDSQTLAEQLAEVKHTSTAQLSTAHSSIALFEKDLEILQQANSILADELAAVTKTTADEAEKNKKEIDKLSSHLASQKELKLLQDQEISKLNAQIVDYKVRIKGLEHTATDHTVHIKVVGGLKLDIMRIASDMRDLAHRAQIERDQMISNVQEAERCSRFWQQGLESCRNTDNKSSIDETHQELLRVQQEEISVLKNDNAMMQRRYEEETARAEAAFSDADKAKDSLLDKERETQSLRADILRKNKELMKFTDLVNQKSEVIAQFKKELQERQNEVQRLQDEQKAFHVIPIENVIDLALNHWVKTLLRRAWDWWFDKCRLTRLCDKVVKRWIMRTSARAWGAWQMWSRENAAEKWRLAREAEEGQIKEELLKAQMVLAATMDALLRKEDPHKTIVPDVGLLLERTDGNGLFVVKRLTKGSVAEIDGRINVNDTLLKVNDVVITGLSMHEVYDLMKGPEGSDLCLHLRQPHSISLRSPMPRRRTSLETGVYTVTLKRRKHGFNDYPFHVPLVKNIGRL